MAASVLVDSNVYISARYPQDRNHERALRAIAALGGAPRLTVNGALEVAQATREKLGAIINDVYSRTDVRSPEVPAQRKRGQVRALLRALDGERRLGTFTKVVEDYCMREIDAGRDELRLLPEWARDEVRKVAVDVLAFSGVRGLRGLPGRRTREDMERIRECEEAVGGLSITGARDREIFLDALTTAWAGSRVVFATFDRRFATEAARAVGALGTEGHLAVGAVEVIDLTTWSCSPLRS